jgi:hypothetical protein
VVNHAERVYLRGMFKGDIALSLITFQWLYWLCEARGYRRALGGRWYQMSWHGGTFWSASHHWSAGSLGREVWRDKPLAKANDVAMGTLVRMLVVLGFSTTLFGMPAFQLMAPICGGTTLAVWGVVLSCRWARQVASASG